MSKEEKKCVLCNMTFPNQELLREHFRDHANKTVDMKGRQTSMAASKGNIVASNSLKKNDMPVENVQCEGCTEVFDSITKAIQHKYRKHPELPSKNYCYYCGMLFPLQCTLNTHLQQHDTSFIPEPDEIWPCTECEAIFYNGQALAYHSGSTHKRNLALMQPTATAPPSKKIKVNNANEALSAYYCHLCGTEYIVKFNLQKHLERQHTKSEREALPECLIKCTTCEALFYNKKAYNTHNVYHKPDDLYVTSEAQRLQTVTRVDQDFDLGRVQNVVNKYLPVEKNRVRKTKTDTNTEHSDKSQISDSELSPASPVESSDEESRDNSETKKSEAPAENKLRVVDPSKLMGINSMKKMQVIDGGDIKMIKRKGKIIVVRKLDAKLDKPVQNYKKKIIIHPSGIATTSKASSSIENNSTSCNNKTSTNDV